MQTTQSVEQQIRAKQREIRRLSNERRIERNLRECMFDAPRKPVSAVIYQFPLVGRSA